MSSLTLLSSLLKGVAAIVLLLIAVAYLYGCNLINRVRLRHIPGPKHSLFVGNLLDRPPRELHYQLLKWPQHGKVCKFFLGRTAYVLITDPELVKQVTTSKFLKFHDRPQLAVTVNISEEDVERRKWEILWAKGKFWATVRAACEPLFHSKSLQSYAPMMHGSIDTMLGEIDAALDKTGGLVEISEPLQRMSLAVVGAAAFGVSFQCQGSSDNKLAEACKFIMTPPPNQSLLRLISMSAPHLRGLLNLYFKYVGTLEQRILRLVRSTGFITGTSKALLHNTRLSEDAPGGDAASAGQPVVAFPKDEKLSVLRRAQLEGQAAGAAAYSSAIPSPNSFFAKLSHSKLREAGQEAKPLNDYQIIAQGSIFVLAGYDTTSLALTYTLYLLARDPAATQRVCAEVDAFWRQQGRVPAHEDLACFKYTEAAFQEAMRLFPPVNPIFVQARVALEDVEVGGVRIPKGTPVVCNSLGMAYDPQIYKDPEEFRPERFLDGSDNGPETRSPFAYIPFGAGPHKCIGYRFAMAEAVFALVTLFKKYTFSLDEEHHRPGSKLETSSGITLAPVGGVWLKPKLRLQT